MHIKIYNTLSRQKMPLKPIHTGEVRLYVCGNTVYDDCHIGHARVFVSFDVVVRFLKEMGYKVHYVRNITDIDDKIIARAQENNETIESLTGRYIQRLREDTAALGVLPPTEEPQATHNIDAIIQMITQLIEKGYAYSGSNGDVYYRVGHFETYGLLSHRALADLQEGARVEVDTFKENPLDFVLWKQAKPAEVSWDSPWGRGRPGWHIECSAMSTRCLGNHFDIHGGGADLLFPHHENERAQSEAATGETFVNTWMHVGFVQVAGDKMSKSLGNFFTIRDVLKEIDAEVLRYFLLASHYRSQVNYSREALEMAKQSLTRLYTALKGLEEWDGPLVEVHYNAFTAAMSDDFNTPVALTVLFERKKSFSCYFEKICICFRFIKSPRRDILKSRRWSTFFKCRRNRKFDYTAIRCAEDEKLGCF
jgi:cysteinyl-tRNA synthetase